MERASDVPSPACHSWVSSRRNQPLFRTPLPSASAFACELSEPQKGTVAEVKDGETLALTDGTVVRLVNAKAPTAPIAARDDRP